MNDFVYHGTTTLTTYKIQTSSDPRSGGVTTITAVSHGSAPVPGLFSPPADLFNYALQLRNNGWLVQMENTQHGNQYTLTATYQADLLLDPNGLWIPPAIWEVETHEVEKNILECTDRPFIADLTTTTKALIELAVKNANPNPTLTTAADLNADPSQLTNAKVAYALKVNGVEGFGRFTTTLKRTVIAPTWYNPSILNMYDNNILSKPFLCSAFYVPNVTAALLPVGDTSIQTDENGVTTYYGYRQYPVNAVSIPPNKVQYVQYWTYNRWSVGTTGGYNVIG